MKVLLSILLFFHFGSSFAQPDNNDPCDAEALSIGNAYCCSLNYGTTLDASDSGISDPGCGGYSGLDIWYSFVAGSNPLKVTLYFTSGMADAAIALYEGSCSSLSLLNCDENSGPGAMPELDLSGLSPGTTYYLRVWPEDPADAGAFSLCLRDTTDSVSSPPINDVCENATTLNYTLGAPCQTQAAGCLYQATPYDAGYTSTPNWTPCGATFVFWPPMYNPNGDVWFKFDADYLTYTIDLSDIAGESTDLAMDLFEGTWCDGLSFVDCTNGNSMTVSGLDPDSCYYIRVYQEDTISTGGDPGLIIDSVNTTFQICVSVPFTLPVSVTDFRVSEQARNNLIQWISHAELNNDYYTVERSVDGIHFETLDLINGAGTSSSRIQYELSDENINFPQLYYRLYQTDFDGTKKQVLKNIVVRRQLDNYVIYPNPTSNTIQISNKKEEDLLLEYYSSSGQLLSENINGAHFQSELFATLPNGIYLVRIINERGEMVHQEKVIKL